MGEKSNPIRLKSKRSAARPPGSIVPSSKPPNYPTRGKTLPTWRMLAFFLGGGFPKVSRIHTRVSMEVILTS